MSPRLRTLPGLALAILLAAAFLGPVTGANAQTMTPPQRAEFNKLVKQRNRLVKNLQTLDGRAADLMKQGREPIVVHAEQVSVQDQLDLIELRLALVATRHGIAVPPPPAESRHGDAAADDTRARVADAFSRGRERALTELRADALRFLASLDFAAFLER